MWGSGFSALRFFSFCFFFSLATRCCACFNTRNAFSKSLLTSHLANVEEQAQELFDRLMKQRSECEGITEKLKAESPMLWVGSMNALREAVTETVNAEVIFV